MTRLTLKEKARLMVEERYSDDEGLNSFYDELYIPLQVYEFIMQHLRNVGIKYQITPDDIGAMLITVRDISLKKHIDAIAEKMKMQKYYRYDGKPVSVTLTVCHSEELKRFSNELISDCSQEDMNGRLYISCHVNELKERI